MSKGDPLSVLLKVKSEKGFDVDDELVTRCYKLQNEQQYDKDRTTMDKMSDLVEKALNDNEDENFL